MMGGGLQRAYGAAKGHAFAGKIVDGTEVCIFCDVTVESCARRKTRCQGSAKKADCKRCGGSPGVAGPCPSCPKAKCEQACAHGQPCSCDLSGAQANPGCRCVATWARGHELRCPLANQGGGP